MNNLPPLNPLHVFTVVARCENLVKAAHELGVTQSAVSRQVSALEVHFGTKLFRRSRYGLEVLPVAKELAASMGKAFNSIADSAENFKRTLVEADQTITIKTYTTFAARWLIPRLSNFCQLHPCLKIVIKTGAKAIDFASHEGDLSIQILNRKSEDSHASLLYQDVIEPICTPDFLRKYAPNPEFPSSLLRQAIISSDYRSFDWNQWLESSGYSKDYNPSKVMNFSTALLGWDAAARGIGLAMGQTRLLEDEIRSGNLVTPFHCPIRSGKYYFVFLPKKNEKAGALLLRDWLLTQFKN